jgi:hypothetical protein
MHPFELKYSLYEWFFIEYWIKTGLDFYPGPFFMYLHQPCNFKVKHAYLAQLSKPYC